jgi:pentatricopeptide repeat protein
MASILGLLGAAYGRAGMVSEARAVLEELEERSEREYVPPVALASVCATVGRADDAFRYLEAAMAELSPTISLYIRYAFWEPIQSDPRFGALLDKMGFAP